MMLEIVYSSAKKRMTKLKYETFLVLVSYFCYFPEQVCVGEEDLCLCKYAQCGE